MVDSTLLRITVMITISIIYLIGFILSYFLIKKARCKSEDDHWAAVIITFMISLLSWYGVFMLLVAILSEKIRGYNPSNDRKPPKWL